MVSGTIKAMLSGEGSHIRGERVSTWRTPPKSCQRTPSLVVTRTRHRDRPQKRLICGGEGVLLPLPVGQDPSESAGSMSSYGVLSFPGPPLLLLLPLLLVFESCVLSHCCPPARPLSLLYVGLPSCFFSWYQRWFRRGIFRTSALRRDFDANIGEGHPVCLLQGVWRSGLAHSDTIVFVAAVSVCCLRQSSSSCVSAAGTPRAPVRILQRIRKGSSRPLLIAAEIPEDDDSLPAALEKLYTFPNFESSAVAVQHASEFSVSRRVSASQSFVALLSFRDPFFASLLHTDPFRQPGAIHQQRYSNPGVPHRAGAGAGVAHGRKLPRLLICPKLR